MRKIDTLFNQNTQLSALNKQVQSHQLLQQFWVTASPAMLSKLSTVGSLKSGQLIIYAHSPIVANKIKLTTANLLTQLQNLQLSDPNFRECKVTAIIVKVQVKSHPKTPVKPIRKLSKNAADTLKKLALDLGESPLSKQLHSIANKISQ
ncbi:MAG: DciA family protein [Pseudomonadota bacterium]